VGQNEPVQVTISDVFDLHPFAARDARSAVEAYLEEAYLLGLTAIRIIHGRGIGVQREMVRALLAGTPFVTEFSDAPLEAGGWGATVVTLKQRSPDLRAGPARRKARGAEDF
jgi:dsDNA-specific endonuclease/ATPase MutS2